MSSFSITMNRAWDLLDETLRQKQKNFQTTLRSDETMAQLRSDTELKKQQLVNDGSSGVANIRAQGGIEQQRVQNQGVLGQQQLQNQGGLAIQESRNQGGFSIQREKNTGDWESQNLKNQGLLSVADVNQMAETRRHTDLMRQRQNESGALERVEQGKLRVSKFTALSNASGGIMGTSGTGFGEAMMNLNAMDNESLVRLVELVKNQKKNTTTPAKKPDVTARKDQKSKPAKASTRRTDKKPQPNDLPKQQTQPEARRTNPYLNDFRQQQTQPAYAQPYRQPFPGDIKPLVIRKRPDVRTRQSLWRDDI